MTTLQNSSDAARQPAIRPVSTARLAYSVPEAAAATGLGRTTLYALIGSGDLPSSKIVGRRLIATADLEALLQRHRSTSARADDSPMSRLPTNFGNIIDR